MAGAEARASAVRATAAGDTPYIRGMKSPRFRREVGLGVVAASRQGWSVTCEPAVVISILVWVCVASICSDAMVALMIAALASPFKEARIDSWRMSGCLKVVGLVLSPPARS